MTFNFTAVASMVRGTLASGQVAAAATATTILTISANTDVKVASAVLSNNNSGGNPVVVSVSVVPSGGSLDATRVVVPSTTLAPGQSATLEELVGAYLEAGAYISVTASVAASLNYFITGTVSS